MRLSPPLLLLLLTVSGDSRKVFLKKKKKEEKKEEKKETHPTWTLKAARRKDLPGAVMSVCQMTYRAEHAPALQNHALQKKEKETAAAFKSVKH